jgi:Zn finger protein HypA/HybF involved in hydrogenase expression
MTEHERKYFLAEGFVVGRLRCLPCQTEWDTYWRPETTGLELMAVCCPLCKSQNSVVVSSENL